MNILEQEDIIKGLPDQALMKEAQAPSGQVPQYLVVSEIQRRSDMRKRFKEQQPQQEGTVKDQVVQEGIMGMMPPMPPSMPMQPSAPPMMPPSMPQMPPPMPQGAPPSMPPQGIAAAAPPQMMSGGGIVRMNQAGVVPSFGAAANPYFALMPYEAKEDFIRSELQSGKGAPDLISSGITTQDLARFGAENPDFVGSEMSRGSFSQPDPNSLYGTLGDQASGLIPTQEERDAKRQARIAGGVGAGSGFDATAGAGQRMLPGFLAQGTDFNPLGLLPNYSENNPIGDAISRAAPSFSVDGAAAEPAQTAVARSSGPFTPSGTTLEEVAGSLYDYSRPVSRKGRSQQAGIPTRQETIYDVLGSDYEGFTGKFSPFPSISGRDYFIQQAVEGNPEALGRYLPDSGVYRTAGANVQGNSPVQRQSVGVGGAFDDLYKAAGIPANSNVQIDPRGLSLLGNRTRVTPGPDAVLKDAKAASDRLDDLTNTKTDDTQTGGVVDTSISDAYKRAVAPKGSPNATTKAIDALSQAPGNDASAPKDGAATDPAVRPELDFANLIADSRRQAMSNALIQLGSGIAAGNVAGGISAAGDAAAAGTDAARKIDMEARLARYQAGREDLARAEARKEAKLDRTFTASESARDRSLRSAEGALDRALQSNELLSTNLYRGSQLALSEKELGQLSRKVTAQIEADANELTMDRSVRKNQLIESVQKNVDAVMSDTFSGLDASERALVFNELFTQYYNSMRGLYGVDEDLNIKNISAPSVSADGTSLNLSQFED